MIPPPVPTWSDVLRLALVHPVMYRALSQHHAGDLTQTEALTVMVCALADELATLQEFVVARFDQGVEGGHA